LDTVKLKNIPNEKQDGISNSYIGLIEIFFSFAFESEMTPALEINVYATHTN